MQTIIVAIIVVMAFGIAGRQLWRQLSGKSKGCNCCNCDCRKDNESCDCGCGNCHCGKKDEETRQ
ncbi:MAG: FeoB-associated Cys-rich membrane protein [Bacteroidaceae bacterium]|nr:FeoB-associated Cys-rich membrane protein [Bacteroidaceae bacterium]